MSRTTSKLEIEFDDNAVIPAGQVFERGHVPTIGPEPNGAVTEREERSTRFVPTAECLRSGAVDLCGGVVHPPHHIANPDGEHSRERVVAFPGKAGPNGGAVAI